PDKVVIPGGSVVADGGLGHGKEDAAPLQLGVRRQSFPDEFRSRDLAPHEIVRVVDDAHLIRLRVADADLDRRAVPPLRANLSYGRLPFGDSTSLISRDAR